MPVNTDQLDERLRKVETFLDDFNGSLRAVKGMFGVAIGLLAAILSVATSIAWQHYEYRFKLLESKSVELEGRIGHEREARDRLRTHVSILYHDIGKSPPNLVETVAIDGTIRRITPTELDLLPDDDGMPTIRFLLHGMDKARFNGQPVPVAELKAGMRAKVIPLRDMLSIEAGKGY
jgi:hypothetical protein